MLQLLSTTHPDLLNNMADAWLQAGAAAMALWNDSGCIARWPETPIKGRFQSVPICQNHQDLGELRIYGATAEALPQMHVAATFIANLACMEQELEMMTSEFIQSQDQQLALYRLTQVMRHNLHPEDVMKAVAPVLAELLDAEHALIYFKGPEGKRLDLWHNPPKAVTADHILSLLKCNKSLLLISNVTSRPLPSGIRNLLHTPIQCHNNWCAGFIVLNKRHAGFASPDVKLASAIAQQVGSQLENVLLHQEIVAHSRVQTELSLARSVQSQLLPHRPPTVPGLDLFGYSRPALQVGGDFYDFALTANGACYLGVGDISGKGMAAALLMAMTRTALRSQLSRRSNIAPESQLAFCNADLYADFTDVSMFATVFVCHYQPTTRQLTYANAGHSPVIYCPAGGRARLLEADGPALGVLPESLASNQTLTLAENDVLIIGTDGLSEATNAQGEMFGYTQLLALVERLADRPSAEIGHAILDAVTEFSRGHSQDDDQTFIIAKGCPYA